MLASTLKPDVGLTFKGLRLVSTYVDLFWKPWGGFYFEAGVGWYFSVELAKGWHIPVPNLGVGGIAPFKGCGWIQRLCSWVQKLCVVHITLGLLLFLVYRFEAGFYFKPCIDSIQRPELLGFGVTTLS